MATEYRTLNDLLAAFKDIGARHKQIKTVFIGQDFDLDSGEDKRFSILAIDPVSAVLPKGENGYSLYSSTFTVKVLDLVNKDLTNEEDVLSDSLETLKDIVTEFNQHPFYIDSDFNIEGDINFTTLRGVFDSDATGWETEVTLVAPNHRYFCGLPLDDLNGTTYYPDLTANVRNSDNTYNVDVVVGQSLTLPDITHIDSDGSSVVTPAQTVFTCTPPVAASGIAYQRVLPTGQKTSYSTYDEGWQLANGAYDYTPPVHPVSYAQLDNSSLNPFVTLLDNNAFGNKNRFTDIDGLQVYTSGYIIDHLTGYGIVRGSTKTWYDHLTAANSLSLEGFNDFRLCNLYEGWSILNFGNSNTHSYAPFNSTSDYICSTTRSNGAVQTYRYDVSVGQLAVINKSSSTVGWYFRNHYT